MTLKEFINHCAGYFLPVTVKDEDLRFIIGTSQLETLKDRNIANREIDLFTIQRKENGRLNWLIVVKKQNHESEELYVKQEKKS